jgi:hypothetical protein
MLWAPLSKNQMAVAVWVCVWVFYPISLIFLFVFVPETLTAMALEYSLKSGIGVPPALVFLFRIALVI